MEKKMENGRSMIEMLGVLAVIGILTVSGFALVGKMHSSHQVSRVMNDISEMALKTRAFLREYDSDNACTHPTCSIVKKMNEAKMIPSGLEYEGKRLINLNDVRFYVDYPANNDSVLFKLNIENLTEEMCLQVATANWGDISSTGYREISINNKAAIKGNVSLQKATDDCSENAKITLSYR